MSLSQEQTVCTIVISVPLEPLNDEQAMNEIFGFALDNFRELAVLFQEPASRLVFETLTKLSPEFM